MLHHTLPLPLVLESGRGGERMREGVGGTGEGAGKEDCVCVHAPRIPRTKQTTKSVPGNVKMTIQDSTR